MDTNNVGVKENDIVIDIDNDEMTRRFEKYAGLGLTGIVNCGNTCYLNSCLQVLSHTYELNDILSSGEYKSYLKRVTSSALLYEWDQLRSLMWSENCIVKPMRFLKFVQIVANEKNRQLFTGYEQNDMSEFFLFLLDCFHEGISREVDMTISGNIKSGKDQLAKRCYEMMITHHKKSYSEMLDLFYGIQVWCNETVETGVINVANPEPYLGLDIPLYGIQQRQTQEGSVVYLDINNCVQHYLSKEEVDGLKDANGKQVSRYLRFWSLPKLLMVNLKRYDMYGKKIHTPVTPNGELDMSPYVLGYKPETYKYELYAIVEHRGGSIQGGHYLAHIKTANGSWHKFNDTQVTLIRVSYKSIRNGSCFFYRKK